MVIGDSKGIFQVKKLIDLDIVDNIRSWSKPKVQNGMCDLVLGRIGIAKVIRHTVLHEKEDRIDLICAKVYLQFSYILFSIPSDVWCMYFTTPLLLA
jgi:hypothetical protein